ncbi:MAG: DUF1259 domain-containing protein [Actinomycetota bacterium]|nr:DUF1259 domain-containing protein [Actinomycetota bacterium]
MTAELNATPISRRRALALGGVLATGLIASSGPLGGVAAADPLPPSKEAYLPIDEIQAALQAQGTVSNGLLGINVGRTDLTATVNGSIPFSPYWQNNGTFYFQALGGGKAIMNGDFGGLLPTEINPFIAELLAHGIVFQALHQHLLDVSPMLYFIHMRAVGDPVAIARGLNAAIRTTPTPLPQTLPSNPTTPLDAKAIGELVGGTPTVSGGGVVVVNIPRRNQIVLDGVRVNPYLNIATPIAFLPLGSSGQAAVVPDFSLVESEIAGVMKLMQAQGWMVNCLYNQETDEHPQLYFSHQLKTGDSLQLAREVRRGLELNNSSFS